MASLSDIVTVNVSTLTTAVKQPGFGTPLIADYNTRFAERVRFYTSLQGLIDDGFTVNDGAYRTAAAIFAQSPQVTKIAIGRRALAPDLQIDLTPTAVNSRTYKVDLIGPAGLTATASFTSDSTATVAEITAGLTSAINTAAVGITATDQTTFVRLKAASAGLHFCASAQDLSLITAQQTHVDPGIATDLAAIALESADWYGLTLSTAGKAEIVAAAAWVESNKKFGAFTSQDGDILGSGSSDVASTVKTANNFRSIVFFSNKGLAQSAAAALLGATFPFDPGSVTFKFRKLAGVTSDALTATQLTNLRNKNAMFFTDYGGISITAEGKTAAGEFADVIRDRDWFESRLQARVFNVLVNNAKVPFTDRGIAAIEAELRAQLTEGIQSGFLTDNPAPVVSVPLASAVASIDKAARLLKPISFTAKVAGAIHAITITGTITV
jgi:hypothetical protein